MGTKEDNDITGLRLHSIIVNCMDISYRKCNTLPSTISVTSKNISCGCFLVRVWDIGCRHHFIIKFRHNYKDIYPIKSAFSTNKNTHTSLAYILHRQIHFLWIFPSKGVNNRVSSLRPWYILMNLICINYIGQQLSDHTDNGDKRKSIKILFSSTFLRCNLIFYFI